jgi:hypothetical protein
VYGDWRRLFSPPRLLPAGQIVGRMSRIEPTRDVIYQLVDEYLQAVERFRPLLEQNPR